MAARRGPRSLGTGCASQDTGLDRAVREVLDAHPGKVVLVRRPDRRQGVTRDRRRRSRERGDGRAGRSSHRSTICSPADLEARRSRCRGRSSSSAPTDAVTPAARASGRRSTRRWRRTSRPSSLWQSSHLGGHRFAPNVLVLPQGSSSDGSRSSGPRRSPTCSTRAGSRSISTVAARSTRAPCRRPRSSSARRPGWTASTTSASSRHDGATWSRSRRRRASCAVTGRGATTGHCVPASCGAEPEPTDLLGGID